MGEKTIRVSEETWRKLQARKRGGESLDSVIKRKLREEDTPAGFSEWSATAIDESIQEVKTEIDDEIEDDETTQQ